MTVPSFGYELAAVSGGEAASIAIGKALPVGRDLELDPLTGDLKLTGGDLRLISNVPAIRQEATIRMRFFRGEWFLDTTAGVPYFQNILVKAPNLNAIKSIFEKEILATAGISNILALNLDFNASSRLLAVSWTGESNVGELVSGTLNLQQGE